MWVSVTAYPARVNLTDKQKIALGKRLAAARNASGLDQSDFVSKLRSRGHRISQSRISDYERGRYAPRSQEVLTDMADILGVPLSQLLPGSHPAATEPSIELAEALLLPLDPVSAKVLSDFMGAHPEAPTHVLASMALLRPPNGHVMTRAAYEAALAVLMTLPTADEPRKKN